MPTEHLKDQKMCIDNTRQNLRVWHGKIKHLQDKTSNYQQL